MITYGFTKHADRQMRKLPTETQKRIVRKIKFYILTENPLHFAKLITDDKDKTYRFRIGDYRIFFDWKNNHIKVNNIKPRPRAY